MLATAHQVLVLGAVLVVALFSSRVDVVLAVTVYASLCDVLWRTTNARGPYEAAKYAAIIGLGAIAIRFARRRSELPLVVLFLLALVPGAIVGTFYFGVAGVREYLTADLATLVVIAVGVLACSALRLSQAEMRGLYGAWHRDPRKHESHCTQPLARTMDRATVRSQRRPRAGHRQSDHHGRGDGHL